MNLYDITACGGYTIHITRACEFEKFETNLDYITKLCALKSQFQ